ncbi:MAG: hypothetical protein AAF914_07405 [Pseudomonadota bacterium]
MDTIFVDLVRYGHLLGVAVGFGAAVMADIAALTALRGDASPEFRTVLHAAHRLIWPALGLMWLSGIALIGIRTGFALSEFSPKLFAKLCVVTALTVNAHAIGRYAMPLMARPGGLGRLRPAELRLCAIIGGISSASWLLALAMGSSRFLAESPALLFVVLVPVAYASAIVASQALLGVLARRAKAGTEPAPEPVEAVETPMRLAKTTQTRAPAPPPRGARPAVRSYRIGLFPRRRVRFSY